ncbi:unnamed protein product [Heligmosomoides polygyrus]|uniref:Ground-like domain-containing protein n=1 Tax=Heligmosomoides polygyrus TaxID=6339 RepID=A0A3P8B905_HELPZ|nr:unnamed protein product [Heligmosomoides polygyrus]
MIILLSLVGLALKVSAQCYQRGCGGGGGGGYQGYQMPYGQQFHQQMPQQLPQPYSQPFVQPQPMEYYYRSSSYAQPPTETLSEKHSAETATLSTKSSEYEEYEKKLPEMKPALVEEPAPTVEVAAATPSTTYIREVAYQPYQPPLRPLPYRQHPLLPAPLPAPLPAGKKNGTVRSTFAQSAKTVHTDAKNSTNNINDTELNDNRCTSKKLKEIMGKISNRSPSIAKRLIQRIAEAKLGGMFSVFCSKEDFTYVSRSETYCQTENNGVVCYAFQHR